MSTVLTIILIAVAVALVIYGAKALFFKPKANDFVSVDMSTTNTQVVDDVPAVTEPDIPVVEADIGCTPAPVTDEPVATEAAPETAVTEEVANTTDSVETVDAPIGDAAPEVQAVPEVQAAPAPVKAKRTKKADTKKADTKKADTKTAKKSKLKKAELGEVGVFLAGLDKTSTKRPRKATKKADKKPAKRNKKA